MFCITPRKRRDVMVERTVGIDHRKFKQSVRIPRGNSPGIGGFPGYKNRGYRSAVSIYGAGYLQGQELAQCAKLARGSSLA